MATSSNTKNKPASKPTARAKAAARKTTATAARKTPSTTGRATASTTTSTQPKTPVDQVVDIAERVVLVPVGVSLLVRDDIVSTVKGLATKYRTRAGLEREIKRYEKRGASARNRFEKQVRRQRTKFERDLRQRRTQIEKTVKQNRGRLEREVRSVRKDFEKQSGLVTNRVEKLLTEAQGLIS
jgi:hypothetical protein